MEAFTSRAKAAAGVAAVLAVGVSAVLLARSTPEPGTPTVELEQPAVEPARIAAPSIEVDQPAPQPNVPARVVPAAANPLAPSAQRAPVVPIFDSPECADLTFVSSQTEGSVTSATVRHGEADPEQVAVGSLLESGEVIFIGPHPQTSAITLVLKSDDGKQCRISAPSTVAQRSSFAGLRSRAAKTSRVSLPPSVRADGVETLALGARAHVVWK